MVRDILACLNRPIVFVGMMGAGKTKIGRLLASELNIDFADSDDEVEKAAGCTISDIFENYGEKAFRDVEKKVIDRLVHEQPVRVISTGGGALLDEQTLATILNETISIWIKADIDITIDRTSRNNKRPLLQTENPEKVIEDMMKERYPVYKKADIEVQSDDSSVKAVLNQSIEKLYDYLCD
jgi:shikimate kinase